MDPDAPFAFLATYTHGLSAHATPQHLPVGQALGEYAGAANKSRLLSLLLPVQRAADRCDWLKGMVDRGVTFAEAMRLMAGADLQPAGAAAGEAREWAGLVAGSVA